MKTIKKVKVRNMVSSSSKAVPNQFVINTDDGTYFQSYDSVIAFIDHAGVRHLDRNLWNYSTTTGKYRNIFLRENKEQTERQIKEGIYKLVDLN